MKKFTRLACVAAATLVLSAVPVAAQAAPGSWTGPAWVELPVAGDGSQIAWRVTTSAGTIGHVERGDGALDALNGFTGTVNVTQLTCNGQDVTLNGLPFVPTNPNDFDLTVDDQGATATGDTIITGTGTWAGLNDSVQIRVYGEGDLERTSHLLENTTGSPITVTWKMYHDFTDVTDVANVVTSTGDNVWDASDIWAGAYGSDPGQYVYSFFWATPDLLTNASTSFTNNNTSAPITNLTTKFYGDQTFNTFTVAPGAKYQLIWFNSNVEATTDTSAGRLDALNAAVAEFGDWEWGIHDRSARGLDVTIPGNWREGHYNPGGNTEASLADTGTNLDGVWVALGLLAAAGGVFAIRRRIRAVK